MTWLVSRVARLLAKAGGLVPTSFVLLGAIVLSLAINVYTSAFSGGASRVAWSITITIAGVLAGSLWTLAGWSLEQLLTLASREGARRSGGDFSKELAESERFIGAGTPRIVWLVFAAFVLTAVCFALVPFAS